jgi:hypothetical protein
VEGKGAAGAAAFRHAFPLASDRHVLAWRTARETAETPGKFNDICSIRDPPFLVADYLGCDFRHVPKVGDRWVAVLQKRTRERLDLAEEHRLPAAQRRYRRAHALDPAAYRRIGQFPLFCWHLWPP